MVRNRGGGEGRVALIARPCTTRLAGSCTRTCREGGGGEGEYLREILVEGRGISWVHIRCIFEVDIRGVQIRGYILEGHAHAPWV